MYNQMKNMRCAGNGMFCRSAKRFFKEAYPYDLVGDSIDETTLLTTHWDVVVMSDVIEHLPNPNWIFKLNWDYLYLSFPETPKVSNPDEELLQWRHYKPDEHLWLLNYLSIKKWLMNNGCTILKKDHIEDYIRGRQSPLTPNITTMMIKRKNHVAH